MAEHARKIIPLIEQCDTVHWHVVFHAQPAAGVLRHPMAAHNTNSSTGYIYQHRIYIAAWDIYSLPLTPCTHAAMSNHTPAA